MRTPYVTFSKSCLYTEFLSLTVFLLIAIISYVIPLLKYGFTIVISHIWFECLLSQFLMVFWRVSTLLATGYDPSSLACSLFIWPGDDTEALPPGSKECTLCNFQKIFPSPKMAAILNFRIFAKNGKTQICFYLLNRAR